jgi:hypothetical protein
MLRQARRTNRFASPARAVTRGALRALVGGVLLAAAVAPAGAGTTARLDRDPLLAGGPTPFFTEGDAASRFTFIAGTKPRFPGDRRGSLRVLYDTTLPTGRIGTPLGSVLSLDEGFRLGAILTIRSQGFAADPNGFSQIAFGLWNSHTTGLGRTLFPSDSFDLVEFDWFANVTSFGGPFLSPSIFGGNVGDNAFFNFAFQSAEVALPFDVPLLCEGVYDAATRTLTVTVSKHAGGPAFTPVPGATATVDLSGLAPGFLVDTLGIAAYGEGWPSLHAEVDFDLIYTGDQPVPLSVAATPSIPSSHSLPVGVVPVP